MLEDLFSKESEIWLLGSILQDGKAIFAVMPTLAAKDFFIEKHKAIYAAMLDLAKNGIPIDPIIIKEKLVQKNIDHIDKDYLFGLMETVSSAANIEYFANLIKEFSIKRAQNKLSSDIKNELADKKTADEVNSFIYGELNNIIKDGGKNTNWHALDVDAEAVEEIINGKAFSGQPTGFDELDGLIDGMGNSEMIVLAAPPSVGKTAFALNIASNLFLREKSVQIFSLETTKKRLYYRLLCSLAKINSKSLRNYDLTEYEKDRVNEIRSKIVKSNLWIDDKRRITAEEIKMKCLQRKCDKNGLDLVIIDYLQLVETPKMENRTLAVGEVTDKLKSLAADLDIPVLCLSQLSRDHLRGNREPELNDLRDSGFIEQAADQAWFLMRKDKTQSDTTLKVAKNRDGKLGRIKLSYTGEYFLFGKYVPEAGKDGFLPHPSEPFDCD